MTIDEMLREMRKTSRDLSETACQDCMDGCVTWADAIEAAMREKDEELDFLRSVKESRGRELDAKDAEIQRLHERVNSAADGLRERDAEIEKLRVIRCPDAPMHRWNGDGQCKECGTTLPT